jgi:hypothetical protein
MSNFYGVKTLAMPGVKVVVADVVLDHRVGNC